MVLSSSVMLIYIVFCFFIDDVMSLREFRSYSLRPRLDNGFSIAKHDHVACLIGT